MKCGLSAALRSVSIGVAVAIALFSQPTRAIAQALLDPNLAVTTVATGLDQPIAMAFIGPTISSSPRRRRESCSASLAAS
jgi:hypothetical protein